MRRFFLIAPLLLGAWAALPSPASAQPAGGITIVPPALPNPSAPLTPIYVPAVMCVLAIRSDVSVEPQPLGAITLSADDNRSVSAGGFRLQASYRGAHDNQSWNEGRSFGVWVYLESSGKLIEQVLFDQPLSLFTSRSGGPHGVVTHAGTAHGFTGLHHVYAPSGAELQYWCDAE